MGSDPIVASKRIKHSIHHYWRDWKFDEPSGLAAPPVAAHQYAFFRQTPELNAEQELDCAYFSLDPMRTCAIDSPTASAPSMPTCHSQKFRLWI